MKTLLKKPLSWIPIALAICALTLPYLWVLGFGPDPTGDEGGAAHLWQILMALQVLFIIIFALRYLPEKQEDAVGILILQIAFLLLTAVPVFLLHL